MSNVKIFPIVGHDQNCYCKGDQVRPSTVAHKQTKPIRTQQRHGYVPSLHVAILCQPPLRTELLNWRNWWFNFCETQLIFKKLIWVSNKVEVCIHPGTCECGIVVVQLLGRAQLSVTPWTVAHQASLSFTVPELSQTHVHQVGDAIQPSHPLLFPSPPAFNLSQHQGLFQWVSSLHQVAKVLELQLHHQSFQWIFRADFL